MTGDGPSFDGRVAVVTGGASGIGAALVERLKTRGVLVASLDVRAAPASDLSFEVDVGDADAVLRAVHRINSELGPPTLAVHCAGITRDAMLWKLAVEDWESVLRVNLSGAWFLLRAMVPYMRTAGTGSVVFVGSINGARGKIGQSAYAASKAGLVGVAKTAARELGRFGVRVNVVAPGFVETPMTAALADEFRAKAIAETAVGRVADPGDIVGAIEFLLSPAARHITGHVLNVDGGQDM